MEKLNDMKHRKASGKIEPNVSKKNFQLRKSCVQAQKMTISKKRPVSDYLLIKILDQVPSYKPFKIHLREGRARVALVVNHYY